MGVVQTTLRVFSKCTLRILKCDQHELCSEIGIAIVSHIAKRFKATQTHQRSFWYLRWCCEFGVAAASSWDFGGLELRLLWLGRLATALVVLKCWRVPMYTKVRMVTCLKKVQIRTWNKKSPKWVFSTLRRRFSNFKGVFFEECREPLQWIPAFFPP